MIEKTCPSFWVKIYIAGDFSTIKQVCRDFCRSTTICVNVQKTNYIYSGGEEGGAIIELINYAKHPKTQEELTKLAKVLVIGLREKCNQKSYSIVDSNESYWLSWKNYKEHA